VFVRVHFILNELRRISGCVKALFADYLCAFCSILLRFGLSRVALAGGEPDVFDS
jgi:molybdenum cofactor biosynthesis enzyme MoaA